MIIIIEGPDGSGKSTLASQLSKQTSYPVVHYSSPKSEEEKTQMYQMYHQAIKESKNIIFDRCWYSEMVYGKVMRGESAISYPQMYTLERLLAKKGALVIYCHNPVETLWLNAQRRGEDYVTKYDTFVDIYKSYNELMEVPHIIPVVKYAYKDM